ncbi:hypothetical protein [Halobacillus halophilus]|uniref:hypothetical protein n=1 Tax=Halobacillus halophilus TaxID=1570 RepID=UPI001CD1A1AA|nr:hypothetical protein [Halobacillus halophilus]MCA1010489.1 hypothetical protein [Halobacillus halophilus]
MKLYGRNKRAMLPQIRVEALFFIHRNLQLYRFLVWLLHKKKRTIATKVNKKPYPSAVVIF